MTEIASKKPKHERTVPGPVGASIVVARQLAKGMDSKAAEVGITFATGEQIRIAATELNASEDVYQKVLASKSARLRPAYDKANAEGRKFIIDSKKVLSIPLGDTWNDSWKEAGFHNAHLKSPKTTVDRIAELDRLSRYFAAHPEHEGKSQTITAERASELHLALTKANNELDSFDTDRKNAKQARDKANQELRSMVTGVIVEIRRRLPKDSPLWENLWSDRSQASRSPSPQGKGVEGQEESFGRPGYGAHHRGSPGRRVVKLSRGRFAPACLRMGRRGVLLEIEGE